MEVIEIILWLKKLILFLISVQNTNMEIDPALGENKKINKAENNETNGKVNFDLSDILIKKIF